jgi:hypothetical protein
MQVTISLSSTSIRLSDFRESVLKCPEFSDWQKHPELLNVYAQGDLKFWIKLTKVPGKQLSLTHRFITSDFVDYLNVLGHNVQRAAIESGSHEGGSIAVYFKE